jgi:DNA-binding transcriptional MerR regulator
VKTEENAMKQWYVKDLSNLTHISVQTLHHYDRIDLLKPSVRLPNGYRVYSEKDLSKLQQIIALKFFGFELSHIKTLLNSEGNLIDHFTIQSKFLDEKAGVLTTASKTLKKIIADHGRDKSIPWETIIDVIEAYRMTQELQNKWVGQILTPEELKAYAKFEQELKTRFTENEIKALKLEWANLVKDVHAHLDNEPTSKIGIEIGQRCMKWVSHLYGKKNTALRVSVWEKGFKGGYGTNEHGLSPDGVKWMDKAIEAYHTQRILGVLNKINTHPSKEVLELWNALLTEICGDEQDLKKQLQDFVLNHEKTTQEMKHWLKQH